MISSGATPVCFEARDYPGTAGARSISACSASSFARVSLDVGARNAVCLPVDMEAPSLEGSAGIRREPAARRYGHHRWCDAIRWNQRATDVDIGKLTKRRRRGLGYRRAERGSAEPIGERDWHRSAAVRLGRDVSDDRQADLPIETADETPDDEKRAAGAVVTDRSARHRRASANAGRTGTPWKPRRGARRYKAYTRRSRRSPGGPDCSTQLSTPSA